MDNVVGPFSSVVTTGGFSGDRVRWNCWADWADRARMTSNGFAFGTAMAVFVEVSFR